MKILFSMETLITNVFRVMPILFTEQGGNSPTLTTGCGGGHMPYILVEGKEDERDLERYSGL